MPFAFIARQGFDPAAGARPLRRFIAREVETPVARAVVAGDVCDGAVIKVGLTDGKLAISYDNRVTGDAGKEEPWQRD